MLAALARRCSLAADRPHLMANVVVHRFAAFTDGTYGDLPVSTDDLPSHVTADAREAAVWRRPIVIGVSVVNTQEFPGD